MILDTSALMAILLHEEERADFLSIIIASPKRIMSAGTVLELHVVAIRRDVLDAALTLLEEIEPQVHPANGAALDFAIEGFFTYGKSRHPAALNFGDCFAYGLAKALDEPLLFKGDDFSRTDITPALA